MSFNLDDLKNIMQKAGVTRLYAKYLRRNNNSKQQFYIARGDWAALQLLPMGNVVAFHGSDNPASETAHKRTNFKADLNFAWLNEQGQVFPVPSAQLILYPKYPEIRLGSLSRGASWSPSDLLNQQTEGRILFLGVHPDGRIFGFIAAHDSEIAAEYRAAVPIDGDGVLRTLMLPAIGNSRSKLLVELRRIHMLGWITSKRLESGGRLVSCEAPQCGGYTLEAELNIIPNGRAEPDYLGWEIKAHTVPNFDRLPTAGSITLMTPNPNGGYYKEHGAAAFLRRYGYPDTQGRVDRINFGGVHRANVPVNNVPKGGIVSILTVDGYDRAGDTVTDPDQCGVSLRTDTGDVIARWDYASLITHWQKKHGSAAYVPMMKGEDPRRYRYGPVVRLGEVTSINYFLRAITDGVIVYDPAPKLENASTAPRTKERHQFRIASRDIGALYQELKSTSVTGDTS